MNVLFVSQCSKRALTETRRLLDQFAERKGDRTWQTPITLNGLDTIRKLLRKTARKNTAVACHWIRGKDHSELLWIVGDRKQFNEEGSVPTNMTHSDVLRKSDEVSWHQLPLISAATALAALFHDLGKSTRSFQTKLKDSSQVNRQQYRHEWVSVRLFQAFVGTLDDAGWLETLAGCVNSETDELAFESLWLDHSSGRLIRDGLDTSETLASSVDPHAPFKALPPLAKLVAWLILTHHRLPCKPVLKSEYKEENDGEDAKRWRPFGSRINVNSNALIGTLEIINADWNAPREIATAQQIVEDWSFDHGLPVRQIAWRKQAARYAAKLRQLVGPSTESALNDPFLVHVSRLCLMLADHHYSSISDEERRAPYRSPVYPLIANSVFEKSVLSFFDPQRRDTGARVPNQTLDEHLLGVQAHATLIVRSLPELTRSLPALKNHPPLERRSGNTAFAWQDKAVDLASACRAEANTHGAFIINLASTGSGKTIANARIMNALANPSLGFRCAFAIGLRVLTLQTGRSFQNDLGLGDEQLAIHVGGAAQKALFEYWEQQADASGSASRQELIDEVGQVHFEGDEQHPLLQRLTDDSKVRQLVTAPLLVCTVDHLTPATESVRGGRQIAPMLRLLTSDLVLDEPDEFDMSDLPALTRLVHWAGMLGSKVLLSSATLPPAFVEGLFRAYKTGRESFQRNRGERPSEAPSISCLWVDEFRQDRLSCADGASFADKHKSFVEKRCAQLAKQPSRRLATIAAPPASWSGLTKDQRRQAFATFVRDLATELHQAPGNHSVDEGSGKRVSVGLVRMANIEPLYEVAKSLCVIGAPNSHFHFHLCVYHSQFPMLSRSAIETKLDTVLKRKAPVGESDPFLEHADVQEALQRYPAQNHIFIVLGTPVTEVGRDHDYDWAIVEPSSVRSFIQLAGRVRRHRPGGVIKPNVALIDKNLRSYEVVGKGKAAFCKPGFEADNPGETDDLSKFFYLRSHSLADISKGLFNVDQVWPIDAQARIKTSGGKPKQNLADLEHVRMRDCLLPRADPQQFTTAAVRDATLHWHEPHGDRARALWLTGLLPQLQHFREDSIREVELVLLPDEDEETLELWEVRLGKSPLETQFICIETNLRFDPWKGVSTEPSVTPWGNANLLDELRALAQAKEMSLRDCAVRYSRISVPKADQGWWIDDWLGFSVKH